MNLMPLSKVLLACLLALGLSLPAFAAPIGGSSNPGATSSARASSGFVVQAIEVEGLKRVSKGTVLKHLPIQVGQVFHLSESSDIIHRLYATGLFDNVQVARRHHVLVIQVVERATIAHISIVGNQSITKKELFKALRDNGLKEGGALRRSTLAGMEKALENQYALRGRYDAVVQGKVTQQSQNRVAIRLYINEGRTAKITAIRFEGNEKFSDHKLRSQMSLTTGNLWTFITASNHYSAQRLDADLQKVSNFYMDHGFLQFKVLHKSVKLKRKGKKTRVEITITVSEGDKYRLSGYDITGELILSKTHLMESLKKHSNIKIGGVFSRQDIIDGQETISTALGDVGYAFTSVEVIPQVDEKNHQVFIAFHVMPGHRVYIRRISFHGNKLTSDWVLRREVRQMEGSLFSVSHVKSSERHLNLLEYIKDASVKTQMVSGAGDQVDLDFGVTETNANKATFTLGYGSDGVVMGVAFTQANFLGSGSTLGLQASKDDYQRVFSATYYDPYFTQNGVGRGFHLYAQKTTPDDVNVSAYNTDVYGGKMYFSIPVGDDEKVSAGIGYESTNLDITPAGLALASTQASAFTAANGTDFRQVLLTTGWNQDKRNRAIFPTKGVQQSFSLQVTLPGGKNGLEYYTIHYYLKAYVPVFKGFVINARAQVAYGDGFGSTGALPFFRNFYAGGVDSVRGYQNNTLGPQDSNMDPFGGNLLMTGSLGIILPQFSDKLRASVFVDAGNVFLTKKVPGLFDPESGAIIPAPSGGVDFSDIRASAGVGIEWRTPFAPLALSIAFPLNKRRGDRTETFQFNIGTSF